MVRTLFSGRMLLGFLTREFVAHSARTLASIKGLRILPSSHVVTNLQLISRELVNPRIRSPGVTLICQRIVEIFDQDSIRTVSRTKLKFGPHTALVIPS